MDQARNPAAGQRVDLTRSSGDHGTTALGVWVATEQKLGFSSLCPCQQTTNWRTPDDDEAYRRRILVQLNRGEARHMLARAVFHGKRGELRQRCRQGQEDQLGALGLIVNAVVLWNTIYMDAALKQLRKEGFPVLDEDVARLSPLGHDRVTWGYV